MAFSKDIDTFTYHVLRDPLWETQEAVDKARSWVLQTNPVLDSRRKHETKAVTFFRMHFEAEGFTRVTVVREQARQRILAIGRVFCADDDATIRRRFCDYPEYLSLTQYCRDEKKDKNEEDRDHIFAAYSAFFPLTVYSKFQHAGAPVIEIYALSEDSIPAIRAKLLWIATELFELPNAEELVRTHFLITLDNARAWERAANGFTSCRPSGAAIEIPRNLPPDEVAEKIDEAFAQEEVDALTALLPALRAPVDAENVNLFPHAAKLSRAERIRLFRDDVLIFWALCANAYEEEDDTRESIRVARRHLHRVEELAQLFLLDIRDEDVAACFEVHDRPLPPYVVVVDRPGHPTLLEHAVFVAVHEYRTRFPMTSLCSTRTDTAFAVPIDCMQRANQELDEICAYVATEYALADPKLLRGCLTITQCCEPIGL